MRSPPLSPPTPNPTPAVHSYTAQVSLTHVPRHVYRVHRPSSQTSYTPHDGFRARNNSTQIKAPSALSKFGLAHIFCQTNISSPFISVYDNQAHAEAVAKKFAYDYREDTFVVTVDTLHLCRGPIFRVANLLEGVGLGVAPEEAWRHAGEYLVMYRIPAEACSEPNPTLWPGNPNRRLSGAIGDGRPGRSGSV